MNRLSRLAPRPALPWLLIAAVCALLFLTDLALVLSGQVSSVDGRLDHALYGGLRSHLPGPIFLFLRGVVLVEISFPQLRLSVGFLMAVMLVAAIALIRNGRVSSAVLLLVSIGGAVLGPVVLKSLLVRPPPSTAGGHTFPSTHASGWFIVCVVVTYLVWHLTRRRGPTVAVGMLGALLCLTAGLYALRYHSPSEVLGGFLFAGAWFSSLVACFLPRLNRESVERWTSDGSTAIDRAGVEQSYRRASTGLH